MRACLLGRCSVRFCFIAFGFAHLTSAEAFEMPRVSVPVPHIGAPTPHISAPSARSTTLSHFYSTVPRRISQPTPGTFSLSSALGSTGLAAGVRNRKLAQASQSMISGIEVQLQARRDEIQRSQCQNRPGEECASRAGRPLGSAGGEVLSYKNNPLGNPPDSNRLGTALIHSGH
jgi:hypothetical protein